MERTDYENKPETLGRRVASRRALKGWTQAELARRIGIHPWQVSRIEADTSRPSLPNAMKLAREFDVSLDWLAYGDAVRQDAAA